MDNWNESGVLPQDKHCTLPAGVDGVHIDGRSRTGNPGQVSALVRSLEDKASALVHSSEDKASALDHSSEDNPLPVCHSGSLEPGVKT